MRIQAQKKIDAIFQAGNTKEYSPGELILRGEDPDGVVFIESGFVKVYSISDSGGRYVHVLYKNGEIFPLIWALKDIRRRIFYEAATDVTVRKLSKESFLKVIRNDAKIANQILGQLAEQFYVFADRLDNLQYKPAEERIIHRLLFLAARFGKRNSQGVLIDAPTTHEFIAESINLARETVSRELEKLEKSGLIQRQQNHIVIMSVDKLAAKISEPMTLDLWGLS